MVKKIKKWDSYQQVLYEQLRTRYPTSI